jgi:phospholipase C
MTRPPPPAHPPAGRAGQPPDVTGAGALMATPGQPQDRTPQRPRPDLPPGTDLLPQIRHIVVVMMENHSYDNYLGLLAGRGEGLRLDAAGQPDVANLRLDGTPVPLVHAPGPVGAEGSPSQSWHASHLQWDDGRCDGFVASIEKTAPTRDATRPMTYWTQDDLPFYYGLAATFPLADHWFCSCLGPTFPNRRFLISGTAHGLIDDLPFCMVDYPPAGTIFDLLEAHGISWVNYHGVQQARLILRRLLGRPGLIAARRLVSLLRWLPPAVKAMEGNKQFTADLYPLGLVRCLRHVRPSPEFFQAADTGTLPAFCIVDPDFAAYSEENPQDIRKGESYAAEVIRRVMHGPGWPHTLLIWLYDEHGGYYDHVPPPSAVPPDDIEGRSVLFMPSWLRACLRPFFSTYIAEIEAVDAGPRRFDRYGFRVPAVIVSPYARPGYVCGEVFDHTSVLKLIQQKWNLPALTRRDTAAASPLAALDLDGPPSFLTPPELPAPSLAWGSW